MDKFGVSETMRRYAPELLSVVGIASTACAAEINYLRMERLAAAYGELRTEYDRYMRRTRSNNWLKMHGYPMRRKIK